MVYAVIKWSMTPFRFLYIQKHNVNILLTNAMFLFNDKAVEKKNMNRMMSNAEIACFL